MTSAFSRMNLNYTGLYIDLKKSLKFCSKYIDFNAIKNISLGSAGYLRTQRIIKFAV